MALYFLSFYRGLSDPAEDLVSSTSSIVPEEVRISSVYPITLPMFGQEIDEQIFHIDVLNNDVISRVKRGVQVVQDPKNIHVRILDNDPRMRLFSQQSKREGLLNRIRI